MFARALQACGQAQNLIAWNAWRTLGDRNCHHFRLALGQRTRLIENDGIHFLHRFQRLGILDEHALTGAASGADHDRHRSREAQRAWTRNNQHGYGVHDGVRETRLRSEARPHDEGHDRSRDHGRNKPAGNFVRQPLDGGAGALRLADHLHDLRQHGFAAHAFGAHHETSVAVDGCADHARGRCLPHGKGFARDHGLVHGARSVQHNAIDRNLFSRTDAQAISRVNVFERNVTLGSIWTHQACHLRA